MASAAAATAAILESLIALAFFPIWDLLGPSDGPPPLLIKTGWARVGDRGRYPAGALVVEHQDARTVRADHHAAVDLTGAAGAASAARVTVLVDMMPSP
jgi:hypothetical protein